MTFMSQPFFHAFPLRAAALAALCVAAAAQTAHATNGYFSHGYGVKSQAIAGVGIALPQDGLTAATNPVRISAIVDACFRLIVDGVSVSSWTRKGCAQAGVQMYLNRPRSV